MVEEGGVAVLGIVVGPVVADFEIGLCQAGEAVAVEQFGFEAAAERCGVGRTRWGVVVGVVIPAHALDCAVAGQ